jgi:hypothetical protein
VLEWTGKQRGEFRLAQSVQGELMNTGLQVFAGLDLDLHDNDTAALFHRLESGEDVASVLAGIEGP